MGTSVGVGCGVGVAGNVIGVAVGSGVGNGAKVIGVAVGGNDTGVKVGAIVSVGIRARVVATLSSTMRLSFSSDGPHAAHRIAKAANMLTGSRFNRLSPTMLK